MLHLKNKVVITLACLGITGAAATHVSHAANTAATPPAAAGQAAVPNTPTIEAPKPLKDRFDVSTLRALADLLVQSWQHGFNPDQYDAAGLATELQSATTIPPELDEKLTSALVHYARDLSGMRIKASTIDLRKKDWRQPPAADEVRTALLNAANPVEYLNTLVPKSALYKRLQAELIDLKAMIEEGKGDTALYPVRTIKRAIRPGDSHSAIAELRQRLGARDAEAGKENYYDDHLAQIVMQFQRNHGLKDDGIIGTQTLRFFNQTRMERYRQVIANLERIRWLEPEKPKKYIVVNIPAATLWAVEDDQVKSEMPVIVGRSKRPTNQFRAMVSGVRFNPTWTVPETIKKEDFLPELQKDANFLASKGVEVWKKNEAGEKILIDPKFEDWTKVTEENVGIYEMVQPSGRSNVLGKVRVLMPNEYGIYLHDTNTPEYFRDDARSVSSGCIRLSRPVEIARFVLEGAENWSDEKLQSALAAEKTREVPASPPFPVLLLYQTAWMRSDGSLVLAYDIYEEDKRLYQTLLDQKLIPVFKPVKAAAADSSATTAPARKSD